MAEAVGDGVISAVNLHEVIKELLRRGADLEAATAIIDALHLDVRAHDRDAAVAAAALYPVTRSFGAGLGDRCCLSLAITEGLPALTADRAWGGVEAPGLEVRLIR